MLQHDKQPTPEKILELGFGFWGSKTLLTAVELGLFTELAPIQWLWLSSS
ncbi:O-methyltransferase family 2 [Calothrix sp. NIES-4071]|nr:O-methyltransferase family 2 [Calothrix sp. NIES-4071]BAZ56604.1 O-methyltransferase family 2 [Calothrix sp. NIES-4105]